MRKQFVVARTAFDTSLRSVTYDMISTTTTTRRLFKWNSQTWNKRENCEFLCLSSSIYIYMYVCTRKGCRLRRCKERKILHVIYRIKNGRNMKRARIEPRVTVPGYERVSNHCGPFLFVFSSHRHHFLSVSSNCLLSSLGLQKRHYHQRKSQRCSPRR